MAAGPAHGRDGREGRGGDAAPVQRRLLPPRQGRASGEHAERAIKAARAVEHGLLAAFAALPRDGGSWERTAALEVYRGYSDVEHALLRVADRTWYAVLRAI